MNRYIVGFLLIVVGIILTALGVPVYFCVPVLLIGVFLFASFTENDTFIDYVIADTDDMILRRRHYIVFYPFLIVSNILTLGRGTLKIPYKQEYFKATANAEKILEANHLTRKEYLAIRNEQRMLYSTRTFSKAYMTSHYTVEDIALPRKKNRLIAASVIAGVLLLMLVEPVAGIWLTLIYEAVFLPMVLLWIPDYKDAKILQQAYDNAVDDSAESQ